MVDLAQDAELPPLRRGAGVGRYTILAPLGRDGLLWAAYDPELDRKVALKLLQAQDADAQGGLVREAKAMARLSHPNVVAVHDVGIFGARVFVAMELVDGVTLRDWLAERPRTRAAILAIFRQAARGLAAAHAAGLVHGDFEPGNVMLARDGSVRVTSFAASQAADARADQLAFCAALREALPAGSVPVWLDRVLLRGLAVAPTARWPSMNELVVALGRDPARTRRRAALALGLCALVGLSAAALARRGGRAPLCEGGPARLAGVWEGQTAATPRRRRDEVGAAFLASAAPAAREVWERVAPLLDRYAARWLTIYRDTCAATHVRGEALDLGMTCLDERRTALAALTQVFATADRDVVTSAVDATNALPDLERCADGRQLLTTVEPPRDAVTRARVDDLRRRAAGPKALNDAGKHEQAMALTRPLLAEARRAGYRPLVAEMLMAYGRTVNGPNFQLEVVASYEEALWTSLAVGRDDLAAEAAVGLVANTGGYLARYDEGHAWAELASAILDRLGDGQEILRSWLLTDEASMMLRRGDFPAGVALSERAIALKEKVLPPNHPDLANTLNLEAEGLSGQGRFEEALAINRRVYALYVGAYGPASTEAAFTLSNRGEYLIGLSRAGEALEPLERALAAWEGQVGPEHPYLGFPLTAMGRAWLALGKPANALPPLERSVRLRDAHEPDAALVAEARFVLARALWDAGEERRRATSHDKQVAEVDAWLQARHSGGDGR
jgi:tetratricopeptide (TPR) repeat protein